ncbi:MAG: serine-type D-Ala-D-Ala carboxypeptidase [Candidatus Amesbacteria bacterium GW2011_GWA2_47_11b]|uniref:Serine-type D-Ala-D-Ala carboxypeptidase n=3 Tax=Candidatus Amesiibacteriota TaxID=1752730 RepID=A0A0G1USA6_9BACT|nr:MAG: serine-type D-Ala-D-Ala carboxypeptidase [Microgenomates group bacterium GW2011_GWC1_46_20]KKU58280.1 MAG: serine-type D-Ala-D-Ala carboxypeptidase [Candidatus Amesbacteria bacterium GW2011_GWA2_47_11b]KKU68918.1 MAG: serine-type D-Ala-D-Ala carboxypeptidase [Candidatus Amesbacteria bacterium GW2011_GWA1_47_20]KKU83587.1 MAG: serine-type D-Ala-D-Ala carboxypeptidase [Candidatus Amesbacteria bacterium GW2011_GWC2_47_8]
MSRSPKTTTLPTPSPSLSRLLLLLLVLALGGFWISRIHKSSIINLKSTSTVVPISQNLPPPTVSAKNIFIIDQASQTVFLQKSADQPVFPASTTKMMTALVVLDNFSLDQPITVTRSYPIGQHVGFRPGETLTVEQLLYATLVQSGNDAAEILAENFPAGRQVFIDLMNVKAAALNLDHTHFANPTGIDESGHYSSAADLARLASFALKNPEFARIVSTENSIVSNHILTNVNELLGKIPGVLGVKTGFTDGAGQSLVTLVNRDDHPVIMVVLGSLDRFGDSEKLIDWVYSNFKWDVEYE